MKFIFTCEKHQRLNIKCQMVLTGAKSRFELWSNWQSQRGLRGGFKFFWLLHKWNSSASLERTSSETLTNTFLNTRNLFLYKWDTLRDMKKILPLQMGCTPWHGKKSFRYEWDTFRDMEKFLLLWTGYSPWHGKIFSVTDGTLSVTWEKFFRYK